MLVGAVSGRLRCCGLRFLGWLTAYRDVSVDYSIPLHAWNYLLYQITNHIVVLWLQRFCAGAPDERAIAAFIYWQVLANWI